MRLTKLLWTGLAGQCLATYVTPYEGVDGKLVRRDELPPNNANFNPPPSEDPWYQAPEGWQTKPLGAVLKTRPHAYPTINIRNCLDTFQMLYRTSNSHGEASWAVSTIFVPATHANCSSTSPERCAHGVVSYQLATDSVWSNASPSYLLQARDPWGEMRDLLAQGWFVATPDYEGPNAAYCAGKQAGHAILDGVRAVLAVGPQLGLRMDKVKVGSTYLAVPCSLDQSGEHDKSHSRTSF